MNSGPSAIAGRYVFPSRIAVPGRGVLARAAALAAAVHLWLLFGISWDMPLPSAGGVPEITVEIASASAPSAARNAPDNSPAGASSAMDNPAEITQKTAVPQEVAPEAAALPEKAQVPTVLPEHATERSITSEKTPEAAVLPQSAHADAMQAAGTRMQAAQDDTPREHLPNKTLPAAATNTPKERPEARRTRPRNPERPAAAPLNGAAGSRNDTAGAAAERESASGAALSGASADESLQTVYNPAPRYPEQARKRGNEGTVFVEADVDERGIPTAVRVQRSSGHAILDDAAVEAVSKWRFRPVRITGKAVARRVVVPIEFRLKAY